MYCIDFWMLWGINMENPLHSSNPFIKARAWAAKYGKQKQEAADPTINQLTTAIREQTKLMEQSNQLQKDAVEATNDVADKLDKKSSSAPGGYVPKYAGAR